MIYERTIKRALDLTIAIVGMPFLFASFIIVAPAIIIEDRGPVFYKAERRGRYGKPFKMFKYRSMIVNAPDLRNKDNSTFNADNDFRVTRIGKLIRKTSIDEIPQILNVLRGDMSIIGPRPITTIDPIEKYDDTMLQMLNVRPGITGFTQAYYRNSIGQSEKFLHDANYANNVSFMMDLKIFFKTIQTVVTRKNIYINDVKDSDIHEV